MNECVAQTMRWCCELERNGERKMPREISARVFPVHVESIQKHHVDDKKSQELGARESVEIEKLGKFTHRACPTYNHSCQGAKRLLL